MSSASQPEAPAEKQKQIRITDFPRVPPLLLSHYDDTGTVFPAPYTSYYSLGHCLRSNVFPGAPMEWKTLLQDSYGRPPPPAPRAASQRWHGRKADDLVRWTEMNIVNKRLLKMLNAMDSKESK